MEKLIYAIVQTPTDSDTIDQLLCGIPGLSGATLYALFHNDIAVVVSDGLLLNELVKREMAIDFATVIESLSAQLTLLPVRFGSFLPSDADALLLLSGHYSTFRDNLDNVAHKSEFGLKVSWDYVQGIEKVKTSMKYAKENTSNYIAGSSPHASYLQGKIKKNKLDNALRDYIEKLLEELVLDLAIINPEYNFRKMITANLVLDAVFLVVKEKKYDFIQVVGNFKKNHPDLHFLLTGPWPPYSFAVCLTV